MHADLTRRSVLVVGLGSVGLDIAVRLAATGITHLGLMDFDTIKLHNLDRLIGATATDAWLRRSKLDLAQRLAAENATASSPVIDSFDLSICEPTGLAAALDFDQIICCVDRPWPRAVLNLLAYRDYIPVIDGGIAIDVFADGSGMRNATWRSHVLYPGRPCMSCIGQLDLGAVAADQSGALDDPAYITGNGQPPGAAAGGDTQQSRRTSPCSQSAPQPASSPSTSASTSPPAASANRVRCNTCSAPTPSSTSTLPAARLPGRGPHRTRRPGHPHDRPPSGS